MSKRTGSNAGAIAVCLAYTIGVILGIVNIFFHWQCIDCSEMRLFLNHWRFYVGGIALMAVLGLYAWFDFKVQ